MTEFNYGKARSWALTNMRPDEADDFAQFAAMEFIQQGKTTPFRFLRAMYLRTYENDLRSLKGQAKADNTHMPIEEAGNAKAGEIEAPLDDVKILPLSECKGITDKMRKRIFDNMRKLAWKRFGI